MRYFVLLTFVSCILFACKNKEEKSKPQDAKTEIENNYLITDTSWGQITASTNFEELKHLYGDSSIKDERICGPECIDSIDVTKIFPNKKNEAIIYWTDSFYHKKISFIEHYADSSKWYTLNGIKTGTPLSKLLDLNKGKINFYGLEWDYGGNIISYNGGALEKSPVRVRLGASAEIDNFLYGDHELNTDMPQVKKEINKIIVNNISLIFHSNEY